ncbi:MAG: hypothetical protein COA38_03585 [Fluviicola sp.]|nr:MAG: hypothetical protein COA38_03585 [Fluviicola sp.]
MKIVLILFLLFQLQAFAQCDTSTAVDYPDVDAQFPGGPSEMLKFIQQNLEYPEFEINSCHQFTGRIYIEFIVCDDGAIQNIHIMRPVDSEFDQFALELVKKMPNWIPAEINNQPVSSRCRLPIIICHQ